MRNKDSDNIYKLYNEAAGVLRAAGPLARAGRGAYKWLRGKNVPKPIAKGVVRHGAAAGTGAALTGGGADGADGAGKNPATMKHHMRGSGQVTGGAPDEDPNSQAAAAADGAGGGADPAPKEIEMLGIQIDRDTAQKMYDQLGRSLGRSSGIEKDPKAASAAPSNSIAKGEPNVWNIPNRGKHGFKSADV